MKVKDKKIINDNAPERIHMADVVDFHICPRPERQVSKPDLYDYQIRISPTSSDGKPAFYMSNIAARPIISPKAGDQSGIQWAVAKEERTWTVEAAIPFKLLSDFVPQVGTKMSFIVVVFDRDRTDRNEWKQWWKRIETYSKKGPAYQRPYLVLGE